MILIADSGSTKTEWCAIYPETTLPTVRFITSGINAAMLSVDEIAGIIASEVAPCVESAPDDIFFYGAGCLNAEICTGVGNAIARSFPEARIEVASDLLAAARALCGHTEGIACILGTGSNSCRYNGTIVTDNVSPLGFILGDEGSGAVLGKTLIGDIFKHQLPEDLCSLFNKKYGLDRAEVIRRVYREPAANRFLASVVPFLSAHIDRPEIAGIVTRSFSAFFTRNVAQYDGWQQIPIGFVGSVAHFFRHQLEAVASELGATIGTVLRAPMDGLIQYHMPSE